MSRMLRTGIEWFIRIALSASFLSAVADRFGLWDPEHSAWGSWQPFLDYTHSLNPWLPLSMVPIVGGIATALEILLPIALLTRFKTPITETASGILLLLFALSMAFSDSVKGPLDYSVFSASAAAFSLLVFHSDSKKKSKDRLFTSR